MAAVNEVVPGLLVYKGELPREALIKLLKDKKSGVTGVLRAGGVPGEYEGLPIAVTSLDIDAWGDSSTACLPSVPIILVWPHAALTTVDWNQVVAHELLHSLGAGHAPNEGPFSTIMRPALSTEHRVGLSKADKNWLRAVYGA